MEATKCLGELGAADLTTIVLKGETKLQKSNCTSFQLTTGCIIALLCEYTVDCDIEVVKAASDALYKVLDCKEGQDTVGKYILHLQIT